MRDIQRRVQVEHTGTDTEKVKPLPPYSEATRRLLLARGDTASVDYTRTGALWQSIQPRIMVKDGKVRIAIKPYGPHRPEQAQPVKENPKRKAFKTRVMGAPLPKLTGATEEQMETICAAAAGYRIVPKKSGGVKVSKVRGLATRVVAPGVKFLRRAHSRLTPNGTTKVRNHYAEIPAIVPGTSPSTGATTDNPWYKIYGVYAARWALRQEEQGIRVSYAQKRFASAQDVANRLAARLGNGQFASGVGARPNPWLQFHPDLLRRIKSEYVSTILASLARNLFS